MSALYIPAGSVCKESLMQIIALFSNLMTFVALLFNFFSLRKILIALLKVILVTFQQI